MRHVAICLLVISVAGCGGDPSEPKTLFEEGNKDHELIEEYIRKEIDKPEGELTKEDLLKVESLTLPGRPRAISDIGPLRGLVNLKRGSLQHNDIEDLTPPLRNEKPLLHFPQRQSTADDGRHQRSERGPAALQRRSQHQVISSEVIFAAWPLSFGLRRNCQLSQLLIEPLSESVETWPKANS